MSHAGLDRYPPIRSHAVIGDCHTAALVSDRGSIDWFCPGRFDAPALFCRLLDADRGGYFSIEPAEDFVASRRYLDGTNVLESTFRTGSATVRLTDFMPVGLGVDKRRGYDVSTSCRIVRLVEGVAGEAELAIRIKPTFDYGRADGQASTVDSWGLMLRHDGTVITLSCPGVTLEAGADDWWGTLRLRPGERVAVTLATADADHGTREAPRLDAALAGLEQTLSYWRGWSGLCQYRGPYRQEVLRSALALKLLIYEPTGAVVAAPTTSLPEKIGGVRNWDYRYSWLRDSALILYALMTVGYGEEAADFIDWLHDTCGADAASPQVMYAIDGGRCLPEIKLDHLEGYRGSRPVRIGNAASDQKQLDIYGEVLSAAYLHYRLADAGEQRSPNGRQPTAPPEPTWRVLRQFVDDAVAHWKDTDHGIWEIRGDPRPFVYSKLMCWAAVDRGLRLAQEHGLEAPVDRWRGAREDIRHAILTQGYNQQVGAFTQSFGSADLDASALMIPLAGLLPATDPRVRSTVELIRGQLTKDGLVYRYRSGDTLPGGEGTFALCTFWLVDALALGGRLDEAHDLFERVLSYANDVGLLSEEIDPRSGEMLGNFPQGFTHLALIRSAVNLAKAAKHGPEEEAENEAERAGRAGRAAQEGHTARPNGGTRSWSPNPSPTTKS